MLKKLSTLILAFYCFNAYAQTKSFTSRNIDSLLIAQKTHNKMSLANAYCLDQISNFYIQTSYNPQEAEKYVQDYLEISNQLQNEDVQARSAFRKAHLTYINSNKKELDVDTFIKTFKWFKKSNKSTTTISTILAKHSFSRGEVSNWYDDGTDKRMWLELSGDDYIKDKNYEKALKQYTLANYQFEYDDDESILRTGYKALDAAEIGEVRLNDFEHTINSMTFLLLSYKDSTQFNKFKKRVLALNKQSYTHVVNFTENQYREAHKHEDPKEIARLAAIRKQDSILYYSLTKASNKSSLEPGTYYADFYGEFDTSVISLTLNITSFLTNHPDENNYEINISNIYKLNDSIQILCSTEDVEGYEARVLFRTSTTASLKYAAFVNFSAGSDSAIFKFIKDNKYDGYTKAISPARIQYYSKERYNKLRNLPFLPDSLIPTIREDFLTVMEKDSSWYYGMYMFNYHGGDFDSCTDILRRIVIKRDYNPFQGLYALQTEAQQKVDIIQQAKFDENYGFLGGVFNIVQLAGLLFTLFIIAVPAFIIYSMYRKRKIKNATVEQTTHQKFSDTLPKGEKTYAIVKKLIIVLTATVLCGIAGLLIGFETAPNSGGGDLRPPIFGFLGMFAGGVVGLFGGIILSAILASRVKKNN